MSQTQKSVLELLRRARQAPVDKTFQAKYGKAVAVTAANAQDLLAELEHGPRAPARVAAQSTPSGKPVAGGAKPVAGGKATVTKAAVKTTAQPAARKK